MEKTVNNFEWSLFIWQVAVFAGLILATYFIVKIARHLLRQTKNKTLER